MGEVIEYIDIKKIKDFPNHPFKINNDLNYKELEESILENGVNTPAIVRKLDDGNYELISGHRRKKICEENKIQKLPCIVKKLSKEQSIIMMVDSNLQRDKILPSEKALAYKLKLEALSKEGKTLFPSGTESQINDTKTQTYRYIRLTYLIPELIQLVDDTVLKDKRSSLTMGIRPAVELSYLSKDNQQLVADAIDYNQATPSHGQAMNIRKLAEQNKLNDEILDEILSEEKGNQREQISISRKKIEDLLPADLIKKDKRYIEQYIIKAIENYKKLDIERGDAYDLDM